MIDFSVKNKLALVTGSSRGIGLAMAVALADAGADIISVSSTMPVAGSEVQAKVEALGKRFYAYECNLSERKSVYAFLNKVISDHPVIDILVNNAGAIQRQPAAEHTDEKWDNIININLNAQFIIAREIGKKMIENGKGKIIFTASLLSFQGGINVPGYAASKGAISSLLKAFANEWASKGINVNGIAPGYVATDNTAQLRGDDDRSQAILARIPTGRWGTGEDIAGATVFLASPASDYINGTIIVVDGGWMGR